MAAPLLQTKFYIPAPRPTLVPRLHLIQRLNQGMSKPLTLITAPAGFGKTTTLSMWMAQNKLCAAWLSLDEGDNDPVRFWTYFLAALQALRADMGKNACGLLSTLEEEREGTESFLTVLLNELTTFPDDLTLVLDDYHAIRTHRIHEGVAFLLGHLPTNVHLVISSRAEPPLPLARLRARDQMVELRSSDLRFSAEEAAAFLNQVMGLNLSPENIAALEARTEGWITGLQLAALSMQGHPDVKKFIDSFTGSQRYILDYLVDEVLENLPDSVRTFLLETSILDRFTGSLCEAVTGQAGGQVMLEQLEQRNLFIVPLDDRREWYRYQHLFADVLRAHLKQIAPEKTPKLHRQAAAWLEADGVTLEAIGHSLAGTDYPQAFRLIAKLNQSEPMALLNWVKTLPEDLVRSQPELSIQKAYAHLAIKNFPDAEVCLQEAERNAKGDRLTLGKVAVARATLAAVRGESDVVIELAHAANTVLPVDARFQQDTLGMSLGIAYRIKGETAHARQALAEAASPDRSVGNLVAVTAMTELGRLDILEGRLRQAGERYQQALAIATNPDGSFLPVAGRPFVAFGQILYEWGDFDRAMKDLELGIQLSQDWWLLPTLIEGCLGLARLQRAQGDAEAMRFNLKRAEQLAQESDIRYMRSIVTAAQAQLSVAQGELDAPELWAMAQLAELDENFELTEARYCEQAALAHWLIARGRQQPAGSFLSDAARLLKRMARKVERAGLTGRLIEILMLQALNSQAQGDAAQVFQSVIRMLSLAEPEGYLRLFVDEGEPLQTLFTGCQLQIEEESPALRPYLGRILTGFTGRAVGSPAPPRAHSVRMPQTGIVHPLPQLVEALSQRELEVLRLLAGGLSTQQIADALVITTGTVRNHLKSIYGKLDAHSRLQAVERARSLKLL